MLISLLFPFSLSCFWLCFDSLSLVSFFFRIFSVTILSADKTAKGPRDMINPRRHDGELAVYLARELRGKLAPHQLEGIRVSCEKYQFATLWHALQIRTPRTNNIHFRLFGSLCGTI